MYFMLIISVVLSLLSAFLNVIIRALLLLVIPTKRGQDPVIQEIKEIKTQMSGLNRIDEMAKYFKLERKLNKLMDSKKAEIKERASYRIKCQTISIYVSQTFLTLTCVLLFWNERRNPVLVLPVEWVCPISELLSWPSNVSGGVSFPIWFLVSNTVSKMLAKPFS